jgi:hypothetical protein
MLLVNTLEKGSVGWARLNKLYLLKFDQNSSFLFGQKICAAGVLMTEQRVCKGGLLAIFM